MFCSKCGNFVEPNENYCGKCGNFVGRNIQNSNINNIVNKNPNNYMNNTNSKKSNNKIMIIVGCSIGICILGVIFIGLLILGNFSKYYFSNSSYEENGEIIQTNNNTNQKRNSKYSTVIVTDNRYYDVKIFGDEDAYKLISDDSVFQKNNCPSEIKAIEDEIIKKYDIAAVNLCEMDVEFAREISNVFGKIYNEYSGVRSILTNLTLINVTSSEQYIAAFMPMFDFATSDTPSTYPWVFKTQILLNTSYFLNIDRLESSVKDGSNLGHFPPNATIYSPVAHELGHYLSFLALMKNHDLESILLVDNKNINGIYEIIDDFSAGDFSLSIIKEAYKKCKKEKNITMSIDEWRATISRYAVAKDNSGNYIYDETIAEAFHDVYLNGKNAKDASKYIVSVLKSKLEE